MLQGQGRNQAERWSCLIPGQVWGRHHQDQDTSKVRVLSVRRVSSKQQWKTQLLAGIMRNEFFGGLTYFNFLKNNMHTWSKLKKVKEAGWRTPNSAPHIILGLKVTVPGVKQTQWVLGVVARFLSPCTHMWQGPWSSNGAHPHGQRDKRGLAHPSPGRESNLQKVECVKWEVTV